MHEQLDPSDQATSLTTLPVAVLIRKVAFHFATDLILRSSGSDAGFRQKALAVRWCRIAVGISYSFNSCIKLGQLSIERFINLKCHMQTLFTCEMNSKHLADWVISLMAG